MRKKGFTLIELLAVIVILAVIAIIVTPMIMGTIKSSRENAAKASARNYFNAIEQYIASEATKDRTIADNPSYDITKEPISKVEVSGAKPTSGTIGIKNGQVDTADIIIGDYKVTKKSGSDDLTVVPKDSGSTVAKLTGTGIGDVVLKKYPELTLASGGGCANPSDKNYTYLKGCYLKGKQIDNFVWYSGFVWRIMGLNYVSDSEYTIKMITEEDVSAIPFGKISKYYTSNVKTWLEGYFLNHLTGTNILKNFQICVDDAYVYGENKEIARNDCPLQTTEAEFGLLSLDEYNLAGGKASYLLNNQDSWLLTRSYENSEWNESDDSYAYYDSYGMDGGYGSGIRPIIAVSSDAVINGTDGVLSSTNNGYILNQTLEDMSGKRISEVANSGEYVFYCNRLYRVVENSNSKIELILDALYDQNNDGQLDTFSYGSDFDTELGKTLNDENTFQKWLFNGSTDLPNLIKGYTWYRGDIFDNYDDLSKYLNSSTNSFVSTVGLPKVGEIASTLSLSMLTKNYTTNVNENVSKRRDNLKLEISGYWTFTQSKYEYNTYYSWSIDNLGRSEISCSVWNLNIRPVIMILGTATITSGNGTLTSPFVIEK